MSVCSSVCLHACSINCAHASFFLYFPRLRYAAEVRSLSVRVRLTPGLFGTWLEQGPVKSDTRCNNTSKLGSPRIGPLLIDSVTHLVARMLAFCTYLLSRLFTFHGFRLQHSLQWHRRCSSIRLLRFSATPLHGRSGPQMPQSLDTPVLGCSGPRPLRCLRSLQPTAAPVHGCFPCFCPMLDVCHLQRGYSGNLPRSLSPSPCSAAPVLGDS